MRIMISVGGTWCAFDQAEQLARLGVLDRIISSYPRSRLPKHRLKPNQVVTLPLPEVVSWGFRKVPRLQGTGEYWKATLFDRMASRYLGNCDLLIGWAVFSEKTLKKARSQGVVGCIERGSAHIRTQEDLLGEEYRRLGLRKPSLHSGLRERHLKEYEQADYIIVQSSFAYDSFLKEGFTPEKLLKIPLGVDTKHFRPLEEKRDDIFRVLFTGALTVRKGIPHLVDAFRRSHIPNSELVFVGGVSGEILPFLKRLNSSCRLMGHQPRYHLPWWYRQASIFVAPSIEDGFGQVILEAMACGVPTIASWNSCGPDVIRDGVEGYLVPPGNAEGIAEKLSFLYAHPDLLVEMGKAARRRAEKFSWKEYGNRAFKTFRNVLEKRKGGY